MSNSFGGAGGGGAAPTTSSGGGGSGGGCAAMPPIPLAVTEGDFFSWQIALEGTPMASSTSWVFSDVMASRNGDNVVVSLFDPIPYNAYNHDSPMTHEISLQIGSDCQLELEVTIENQLFGQAVGDPPGVTAAAWDDTRSDFLLFHATPAGMATLRRVEPPVLMATVVDLTPVAMPLEAKAFDVLDGDVYVIEQDGMMRVLHQLNIESDVGSFVMNHPVGAASQAHRLAVSSPSSFIVIAENGATFAPDQLMMAQHNNGRQVAYDGSSYAFFNLFGAGIRAFRMVPGMAPDAAVCRDDETPTTQGFAYRAGQMYYIGSSIQGGFELRRMTMADCMIENLVQYAATEPNMMAVGVGSNLMLAGTPTRLHLYDLAGNEIGQPWDVPLFAPTASQIVFGEDYAMLVQASIDQPAYLIHL